MARTVSVCIPTYNAACFLPCAIQSVLNQQYQDFELVICDDASTDETPDICRSYQDRRIRYIRTAAKSGQAGNFNRCLNEANGELVTILHADDGLLPGFLEARVSRFQERSELDFVFGAVQVIDANGNSSSVSGKWTEDRFFAAGELLEPLLHGCIVCPPSLMIRKSCLEKVGQFRTDLTWGHDWEWNLRLAERCSGYYDSRPMAAYRVHDASGTAELLGSAKNGPQERRILAETFTRIGQAKPHYRRIKKSAYKALSRRHMYFAQEALLETRRSVTRNNLRYAAMADATMMLRPTYWALLIGSFGRISWYRHYWHIRNPMTAEAKAA